MAIRYEHGTAIGVLKEKRKVLQKGLKEWRHTYTARAIRSTEKTIDSLKRAEKFLKKFPK